MNGKNFTLGDNVEHFTIADVARDNPDFRKVLWTGEHAQIVVMTIPPGGQIGDEVHEHTDARPLADLGAIPPAEVAGLIHEVVAALQAAQKVGVLHRNLGAEAILRDQRQVVAAEDQGEDVRDARALERIVDPVEPQRDHR